jgi:hypothetical protein
MDQFYQADLEYDGGHVSIAGEPFGSCSTPTVTLNIRTKDADAVLFLSAEDALEIWTALGWAIHTASGKEPAPVELISD